MSDREFLLRLQKVLNVLFMTVPFAAVWMFYYYPRMYVIPFYAKGNYAVVLIFLVLYALFARVYDALLMPLSQRSDLIYSQVLSVVLSDIVMYVIVCLLVRAVAGVVPFLLAFGAQVGIAILWTLAADFWYYRTFPAKRTVVVYDMREGMEELIKEYGYERLFEVEQVLTVADAMADDFAALREAEAVFLSGVRSEPRNVFLKYCVEQGKNAYVVPRIGDVLMQGAKRMHIFHFSLQMAGYHALSPEYAFFKRLGDIVFSLVALIVTSPVMLVASVAIRREDHGPALYKQTRLTKDGREFQIVKLRSMRVDAEDDGIARLSEGEADERLTKTGRTIRRFRIDELPQFVNVLKGDMSLVGPRPERPEIAAEYEKELPEFKLRLQVKAGLTGLAQVYGRYSMTPYDKLLLDLEYINRMGINEDLWIMFATIKILFLKRSTQ